jgi:hypothetical protein
VKVIAAGTLKCAAVEARARGHDASEHHLSMALWASGAVGVNVDLMRQGAAIRHDASPQQGGSATLSVTGNVPDEVAVMEPAFIIEFRFRWSVLNSFEQ